MRQEPKPRLPAGDPLDLLDWKRRVSEAYAMVRAAKDPASAWKRWRQARDDLFRHHTQSPIPESEREGFSGLDYFDYDPEARVLGKVEAAKPLRYEIGTSGESAYAFARFAKAEFVLYGELRYLELYWLEGYGGGLFLPVADGTSGRQTYGAGRYLLDTVKGADLGRVNGRLVLDFNFAYNPSCAYDPSWVCPLATPANRIQTPIRAGERHGGG